MDRIVINRPPSIDRAMKWIGRLARHEHFGETMTGEEAHTAAAIFLACNHALRRDKLSKSWAGNRHVAAKCGELFERVCGSAAYRTANFQPTVDINF
jgi:hypothetical protein